MSDAPAPQTPEWYAQVTEDIVDPEVEVVDPHHHLWPEGGALPYGLDELFADTDSGHNITKTVFIECGAAYRTDGPAHLAPVGETEFVAAEAAKSAARPGATITGIVAHADLASPDLDEALDAHRSAAGDLFKGIRHAGARCLEPSVMRIPGGAPDGLYADPAFRAGVRHLGELGLTYDTWQYHHQLGEFAALARSCPGTTMVLDHFSTPIGVGQFDGRLDELFDNWAGDIAAVAELPNVVAKLGGLAMPDNGYGWDGAATPPTSDAFVAAQERWYLHAIEVFGPDRCMFESNFPVDRFSLGYDVFWNGAKKIAARFDATERAAMLSGTATRIYSL